MRSDRSGHLPTGRAAWVDAGVGVAGDMLLAALLDAGADLEVVRRDVEAVLPDTVRLARRSVVRGSMRATAVDVQLVAADQPHRPWAQIRGLLERAELPARVRRRALLAFEALAAAEARVHGVDVDEVHFHEVGSWDSIADVVGVCAALEDLGVEELTTSEIALGDGVVRAAHGRMSVPVPAVLELLAAAGVPAAGAPRAAGDPLAGRLGELATPTGVALLVALAADAGPRALPSGAVRAVGVGAGTRDDLPWPNVVRVVVSDPAEPADQAHAADQAEPPDRAESMDRAEPTPPAEQQGQVPERLVRLEANVDDLDPRAWPSVLAGLLDAGALDAWLTPILMKKGRPAHLVAALVRPEHESAVREHLFRATSTFGVRSAVHHRVGLERGWVTLDVTCGDTTGPVRVKVGHRSGEVVRATPEYEDALALAAEAGRPVADALAAAAAAGAAAGLVPGGAWPDRSPHADGRPTTGGEHAPARVDPGGGGS